MHKKRWYVLAGCVALLILAWSVVNIPWFTEVVLGRAFAGKPGVVVRRVHVGQQRFSLPGRLALHNVDVLLHVNGKELTVHAPQVELTGLQSFWSVDRRILLASHGMSARYDLGQAKEVKADLVIDRDSTSGPFTAVEAGWDKLRARDVSLFLMANASGVELRALKLSAYGGRITGKFFVDGSPGKRAGAYQAELFIEGLDLVRVGEVNPEISAQLNGLVTGTLKFEGDSRGLRALDTDLGMPSGGRMSASFLAALTQYLPQSQEKKRLDLLISKGGKIAMESFLFIMKGGEAGKFAGEVHLRSREVNLELNLEHEINADGTVASLLGYWDKFFD